MSDIVPPPPGDTLRVPKQIYDLVVKSDLVPSSRFIFYDWLARHGPATLHDMITRMTAAGINAKSAAARLTELCKQGLVTKSGSAVGKSGQKATVWDVTPALPVRFQYYDITRRNRRRPTRELLDAFVTSIREGRLDAATLYEDVLGRLELAENVKQKDVKRLPAKDVLAGKT